MHIPNYAWSSFQLGDIELQKRYKDAQPRSFWHLKIMMSCYDCLASVNLPSMYLIQKKKNG